MAKSEKQSRIATYSLVMPIQWLSRGFKIDLICAYLCLSVFICVYLWLVFLPAEDCTAVDVEDLTSYMPRPVRQQKAYGKRYVVGRRDPL